MTKKFLKEQNISLENLWVCHDLKRNIRTVDIEMLLEDYSNYKLKKFIEYCKSRQIVPKRFTWNEVIEDFESL
ncbi:MAG: hypothetical protein IT264_11810 [Saprospiraceae bacterium]|nr:hypothetical protein [Saprospiraceae bacterium]